MNKLQWAPTLVLAPAALGTPALAQPEAVAPTVPGVATSTPQQRSPANATTASPPAVTTFNVDSKTAAAPLKEANSFTMDEARRRGQAMRSGTSVSVFCDYQGNVGTS